MEMDTGTLTSQTGSERAPKGKHGMAGRDATCARLGPNFDSDLDKRTVSVHLVTVTVGRSGFWVVPVWSRGHGLMVWIIMCNVLGQLNLLA